MARTSKKVEKAAPVDPGMVHPNLPIPVPGEVHSEVLKVLDGDDDLLAEMLETAEQNAVRPVVTKPPSRPVKAEQNFLQKRFE
jgi:hypothetical protein